MTCLCFEFFYYDDDHDFSVVLRPIIMIYFQPYLGFDAFLIPKEIVSLTYLSK